MATATIEKRIGDLLSVERGILVHGCSAQGVMGAGVALGVRRKYPGAYHVYRQAYLTSGLRVGQIIPYVAAGSERIPELTIVNAITQEFYGRGRRFVDYDAVKRCFEAIAEFARRHNLLDIHFPLIGCGLAGGEWSVIEPIIDRALEGLSAHLWVLE